jgi:MFS family permease
MDPRPAPAVFTRTLMVCVGLTFLIHIVTYLLNTQLPLHVVGLGGSHAQIGWLFAMNTGAAMLLRPQVGGWVDRHGARAVMVPGAGVLLVTMLALGAAASPLAVIAAMAGLGISSALVSTAGSVVVAAESPATRRGEALSLYYVASSVGVALGPAAGFALADLGGMVLNFAAVTALSLAITLLALTLRTPPAVGVTGGPVRLWSPHAVPASLALIVITTGHATVYAFLPLYAAGQGFGRIAWFFPLMSGCTIACRLVLRRASDRRRRWARWSPPPPCWAAATRCCTRRWSRSSPTARPRPSAASPSARSPAPGMSASPSARRSSPCWSSPAATPPAFSPRPR